MFAKRERGLFAGIDWCMKQHFPPGETPSFVILMFRTATKLLLMGLGGEITPQLDGANEMDKG